MKMGHHHDQEKPASLKNLIFAMVINGGIVAFEMVFGLLIQSMALISDAIHNLSDIAAMIFSYWAEKVSHRPANVEKTYGYQKVEFIAAFVNSIALSVAIAFILWEAIGRLTAPPAIPGKEMLWVAVIAFVGNGAATILLQKISTQNFNMRSVWLHSLQDALFSLGVIVGALLIMFFGWYVIDPLISIAISLFIARGIYKIVRQTVNSLLDAVPPGIDFIQVRDDLLALDAVVEVNDLHVWQTGANQKLLSAHLLMTETASDGETIIRTAQEMLLHKYGINHTTLQILPFSAGEMEHCSHCN
jgi:cobalt-zinc-cadmium efflux system protein